MSETYKHQQADKLKAPCYKFEDYGCKCGYCHDCGWLKVEHGAEPSPEVAPMQTCDWCNGTGISKPVYGGGLVATGLSCPRGCPVPAVAPRETQTELDAAIGKVYASEPYENLDDFRNAIVDALKLIAARLERGR